MNSLKFSTVGKEWGFIPENHVSSPPPQKKNENILFFLSTFTHHLMFDIVFGIQRLQLVVSCLISQ